MPTAKKLLIIPTYSEVQNIDSLLTQLSYLDLDVLFVDDGSKDGTIEKIEKYQVANSGIHIIKRSKKMGLGTAYIAGYKWGLDRGYEYLMQMDADGSHQVSDLKRMIECVESDTTLDVVIGSRWVAGGETTNWDKKRELLSRSANVYTKTLLRYRISDSTSGFRIYKAELIAKMQIADIKSAGFGFQIEMTQKALKAGGNIHEVPINFVDREFGQSKMSSHIIFEALLRVTVLGLIQFSSIFDNFWPL
jgi:dolichol-phosphate mannosyltransferase